MAALDFPNTQEERDTLTGLLLAPAAVEKIACWHRCADDAGGQAFVHAMLLRLRNFSAVNLAHGALRGDGALVEVAGRLLHFAKSELSTRWLAARVSGDSFLLAAEGAVSRERWQWLAEELGRQLATPVALVGSEAPIRLHPRIALSRSVPGETAERMLARLNETLEAHEGRPQSIPVWVDGALSPAGRSAAQLEADLAAALEDGGIEVVYQPQYSCADGRMIGAEALARWQHPVLGSIGPDTLFAIAERADLVPRVSHHIVRAALSGARNWPSDLRLSVNVTAADILHADFARTAEQLLAQTGFAPGRLTLEITEQALLCDLDRSARNLRGLVAAGSRVELDDFGAGFCNFRYLKLLPLAGLKLDRSMVDGVAEDARDLAVLRGVTAMARALDLEVTAEGVESEAQRAVVAREGCTTWQGFLGSEPLEAGAFARLAQG